MAPVVATVAPVGPLRRPGRIGASFLQEAASTLRAAAGALREEDANAAEAVLERARRGEELLDDLEEAAGEGMAVVGSSPFLFRRRVQVQGFADLYPPMDRVSRNLRVLARRCAIALWRAESVPLSYVVLLEQLAGVIAFVSEELQQQRLPAAAAERLIGIAVATSRLSVHESLSAVVVLAQLRSMIVDLLELTGLAAAEARRQLPEVLD